MNHETDKKFNKKGLMRRLTASLLIVILCQTMCMNVLSRGITGDDAFQNLHWEEAFRETPDAGGIVQSLVATEDYIITIENVSDDAEQADVVTAYYRNDVDGDGNPVTRYSVAMKNDQNNWEHGNGMAYNPNTNEIYVAPYSYVDEENYGVIFVMDPDTLEMKEKITITDEFTILGIAYDEENDRYIMQSNVDGDYCFFICDSNFQITERLGAADISPGANSQDMEVIGDYIINFPMMADFATPYMNVYSIERNQKITSVVMDIPMDGVSGIEPESVTETSPGTVLAAVQEVRNGESSTAFYECKIPYEFSIETNVENGTITESTQTVKRGEDYAVVYSPDDGCEISNVTLDGEELDPEVYGSGYTFTDVQADHILNVTYVNTKLVRQQEKEKKAAIRQMKKAVKAVSGTGISFGKIMIIVIIILAVAFIVLLFLVSKARRDRRRRRAQARARRRRLMEQVREDENREEDSGTYLYGNTVADRNDTHIYEAENEISQSMTNQPREYTRQEMDQLLELIREEEKNSKKRAGKPVGELQSKVISISGFHEGWPDELLKNQVGHWQDGEWVMSQAEEPGKDD